MRDARVLAIYEGTNGIQANDLVFRKIARDDGAAERGGGGGLGQCVRGRPGEFFHQHLAEIDRWAWVWMGYIQRGICAEDVL